MLFVFSVCALSQAKLPRGIHQVRPHLKNIDNVPLLVPLFTDCTPDSESSICFFSKATKPYMLDRNKSQKYKIRFCTLGYCSCEPAPLVQCLFSPSSPSDPQQWSRWGKTMINDQWDPFNGQKRWSELLSVTTVDVFSVCLWVVLTCRLHSHVWDDEDHAGEQGGYMLSGKLCQFPQQPPVSTEWCQVGTH